MGRVKVIIIETGKSLFELKITSLKNLFVLEDSIIECFGEKKKKEVERFVKYLLKVLLSTFTLAQLFFFFFEWQ